jgi:hypothetical protein
LTRDDFEELEKQVMKEVVRRRSLGGYSVEAEGVLFLSECMLKIVRHLHEQIPRKK